MAAGFEEDRPSTFEQPLHQRIHVLLQQRLAAGDLDERAGERLHLLQNLFEGTFGALVERVRRVTPRAPEIARGEADEDTRAPGVARLALDRVEDLVDSQHAGFGQVSGFRYHRL